MNINKYDNQIKNVLKQLREDLIHIVNKYGPIRLYESGKYRLVVGSYREAVATTLYVKNNKLKLVCGNWINYDVYINDDFNKSYDGVGTINYLDQINIYKLVCKIINAKKK